jgi:hypothetical protein
MTARDFILVKALLGLPHLASRDNLLYDHNAAQPVVCRNAILKWE